MDLVNKYRRHQEFAFVHTIPFKVHIVAFIHLLAPAVEYLYFKLFPGFLVAIYFEEIIIAITIRGKYIRNENIIYRYYNNIYSITGSTT